MNGVDPFDLETTPFGEDALTKRVRTLEEMSEFKLNELEVRVDFLSGLVEYLQERIEDLEKTK